jgi:probable HAF family extracellular repeat protein
MNPRKVFFIVASTMIATLALPAWLSAQQQQKDAERKREHLRYKLIEIGTLGGPSSLSYFGDAQSLNDRGAVVGLADTAASDPNFPNLNPYLFFDPFIHHAFRWKDGTLSDLGAFPGANNSEVGWINDRGLAAGSSTNGSIDPLTGWPAEIAVLWSQDEIISLGTLGGNESQADAINDRGQIAGFAANTVPDSFPSPLGAPGFGTQQRAFLWEKGVMRDLGTLGGPDADALLMNDRGQIAGISYTSSTPNPSGVPTIHPFLWDDGKMLDLGSLGGTSCVAGCANWLNNRGQVVGSSNLTGDTTFHPFLWSEAEGMKDLGTLGGTLGLANWVNESGEVVGAATTKGDQVLLAFLWRDGVMTNLGALAGDACSVAININSHDQVVGSSVSAANCGSDSGRAFLWEDGNIIDLNAFVPSGSGLVLTQGAFINERGEIMATGVLPSGDLRTVLLMPCNGEETGIDGCRAENDSANAVPRSNVAPTASAPTAVAQPNLTQMKDRIRGLLLNRNRRYGPRSPQ